MLDGEYIVTLAMSSFIGSQTEWDLDQELIYPEQYLMLLVGFAIHEDEKAVLDSNVVGEHRRVKQAHALILSEEPHLKGTY